MACHRCHALVKGRACHTRFIVSLRRVLKVTCVSISKLGNLDILIPHFSGADHTHADRSGSVWKRRATYDRCGNQSLKGGFSVTNLECLQMSYAALRF